MQVMNDHDLVLQPMVWWSNWGNPQLFHFILDLGPILRDRTNAYIWSEPLAYPQKSNQARGWITLKFIAIPCKILPCPIFHHLPPSFSTLHHMFGHIFSHHLSPHVPITKGHLCPYELLPQGLPIRVKCHLAGVQSQFLRRTALQLRDTVASGAGWNRHRLVWHVDTCCYKCIQILIILVKVASHF